LNEARVAVVGLGHALLGDDALGLAVVLFYVLLTPIWIGLRAAAWVAELRSRASRR